jgi:hypothetical protein
MQIQISNQRAAHSLQRNPRVKKSIIMSRSIFHGSQTSSTSSSSKIIITSRQRRRTIFVSKSANEDERDNTGVVVTSKSRTKTKTNENEEILEAFFLGKSFAETALERVGQEFLDLLSFASKVPDLFESEISEFQREVLERARLEKEAARAKK